MALTLIQPGMLSTGSVGISNLSATGTPSSTTYLRGDNTWATVTAADQSLNTTSTVTFRNLTITSTATIANLDFRLSTDA